MGIHPSLRGEGPRQVVVLQVAVVWRSGQAEDLPVGVAWLPGPLQVQAGWLGLLLAGAWPL